jgi:predicted signal transduction protein with EAL and GGDEF domain
MINDSLIQAIPDVVAFLRRDGIITHHLGGRQIPLLRPGVALTGKRLEEAFCGHAATLIGRLMRRAFTNRSNCEAQFAADHHHYEVRISPQGPQRVLCVIRQLAAEGAPPDLRHDRAEPEGVERRGFIGRLKESVSDATLRERPLALGLIFLEGLTDIGRLIDLSIADQIASAVTRRLPVPAHAADEVNWYVGPLGEGLLAVVVEGTVARERVRAIATTLCESLAQPVMIGDATFHLGPRAGLAILREDATEPRGLLEHARAAMQEARRGASGTLQFYSDTLRMLPVARLDIEREIRRALAEQQFMLRYLARHDLDSGELVAVQTYMRWVHPLRGEIPPAEFLPIADATGLAVAVSRAALARLAGDIGAIRAHCGAQVRISFGALRQHLTSGQLERDCAELLGPLALAPGQLELRIAERTLGGITRPERALAGLAEFGAALVIDEVGRGFSSLPRLAQLPLGAIQIDRALVTAAAPGSSAERACRAAAALAQALGVTAIAPGIDKPEARARLLALGFSEGIGDAFPALPIVESQPALRRATG